MGLKIGFPDTRPNVDTIESGYYRESKTQKGNIPYQWLNFCSNRGLFRCAQHLKPKLKTVKFANSSHMECVNFDSLRLDSCRQLSITCKASRAQMRSICLRLAKCRHDTLIQSKRKQQIAIFLQLYVTIRVTSALFFIRSRHFPSM